MSVKPIDVDLKGNCHHEEDQNLNEVALLHGKYVNPVDELVRADGFDCTNVVKPVHSFVIVDVRKFICCQDLKVSRARHEVAALIDVGIPIVFHDSVHDFGVKQQKSVEFLHVVQSVVIEKVFLLD